MPKNEKCWCGSHRLEDYSETYVRCADCTTLVVRVIPDPDCASVADDDHDFYGKQYWFEHQEKDIGYPNIVQRARNDLPERCTYWLRSLLKYKLPPARIQELGSAHGGFVHLARTAGYDAAGLELSPAICDFATKTFRVPMRVGPIESQPIEPGSLDAITLMDVLEHLPDPIGTMSHCVKLLKPDGVMLVQTPRFPHQKSYEQMLADGDPFVQHMSLKQIEHLFLFSIPSVETFFRRLGCEHIAFEKAIFDHYDLFVVVSRSPLVKNSEKDVAAALSQNPSGRLALALMDAEEPLRLLREAHGRSEADRAARLRVIQEQQKHLDRLGGEVQALNSRVGELMAELDAARQEIHATRGNSGAQNAAMAQEISALRAHLAATQRESTDLTSRCDAAERALAEAREFAHMVRNSRVYKLLRGMGRWRFVDEFEARSSRI